MQAAVLGLDTIATCTFFDAPHVTGKFDETVEGDGRSWLTAEGNGALVAWNGT